MTDVYSAPRLTYVAPTAGAGVTKTTTNAMLTVLIAALTPSKTAPASMPQPDFASIPPGTAALLCAELVAIQALITAAA